MDAIEMTGKTTEEAVEKALKILDAEKDDVLITIMDTGAKGLFGLGQKPAKVSVVLKHDPVRAAKQFLRNVSVAMGLAVSVSAELNERGLDIDLQGNQMGALIGKHGSTLDALQYLTNLVVNKNAENYVSVYLDTENYRKKRRETLESLARSLARKAWQTRKSVRLEPMSPSERRIIHATLQNEKNVVTFSEGVEPFRNVVIAPKREAHSGHRQFGQSSGYQKQDGNKSGFKSYKYRNDEDENSGSEKTEE